MNFIPSHDNVLIEPCKIGEKTDGGVYMPETARYRTREAIVKAIGPGRHTYNGTFVPTTHKVGQRVIYTPYAGAEVKIDGTDCLIMKDSDLFGVVEQAEAHPAKDRCAA